MLKVAVTHPCQFPGTVGSHPHLRAVPPRGTVVGLCALSFQLPENLQLLQIQHFHRKKLSLSE